MRQLWSMGWCHNRVRVVASHFMVKHLLLPWQWGLKHLWDCQIDADLECDALGWQYVSGCLSGASGVHLLSSLCSDALNGLEAPVELLRLMLIGSVMHGDGGA